MNSPIQKKKGLLVHVNPDREQRDTAFHLPAQTDQLGRFVCKVKEKLALISPNDVGRYVREKIFTPWASFEQEEMWVLLLDTRNRVTHRLMVYRGTVKAILIRPAELLREAVRLNSPALIVTHNHPSGVSKPSDDDIQITRRLCEAAKLLDIQLQDHLIVGENSWVSLKEQQRCMFD